jgi:hypothetical protein
MGECGVKTLQMLAAPCAVALLFAGCDKTPTYESAPPAVRPVTSAPRGARPAVAAPVTSAAPTAIAPAAPAPGAAPAPAPPAPLGPRDEAAALAQLAPLDSIVSPSERHVETARRALVQARVAFLDHTFALAEEDLEVARQAVVAARAELAADAAATAALDTLIGPLTHHDVAGAGDVDKLLATLGTVRA